MTAGESSSSAAAANTAASSSGSNASASNEPRRTPPRAYFAHEPPATADDARTAASLRSLDEASGRRNNNRRAPIIQRSMSQRSMSIVRYSMQSLVAGITGTNHSSSAPAIAPRPLPSEARPGAWAVGGSDDIVRRAPRVRRMISSGSMAREHERASSARAYQSRRQWLIIDPRNSKRMARWDIVTTMSLVFTALFTPYEVGFVKAPQTFDQAMGDTWFWVNRAVRQCHGALRGPRNAAYPAHSALFQPLPRPAVTAS